VPSPSRKFILVVLLTFVFLGLVPQVSPAGTVGIVVTRDMEFYREAHKEFMATLEEKGAARNVTFITQRPHPDPVAWSNASRKLLAADVDVLVTYGAAATIAALREHPRIPVLFMGVHEPEAARISNRNATGVCSKLSISSLLRYLKGSARQGSFGLLYCSLEADSRAQFAEVVETSRKYGFTPIPIELRKPADISTLFSGLEMDALVITNSAIISSVYPLVIGTAQTMKIPTASLIYRKDSSSTIMMSPSPDEQGKKGAEILLKLLNDTPPGSIPLACSSDVEIVFNLKNARELGVKIPMDLVTEATKIIY
jgi:putative ABC transport system substrate-binding protein